MAELGIVVMAALIAPLLVAVAIAIGRSVGLIPPADRQKPEAPLQSHPVIALESQQAAPRRKSASRRTRMSTDRPNVDELLFCQACGHSTSARAAYCRSCGARL